MTRKSNAVDAHVLAARVRDYGLSTQNQVVTMMMGGVFSTAAFSIADIVRTPELFWLRFSLWLMICGSAALLLMRQLLQNAVAVRPDPYQIPLQLASGFFVAANFALLSLSTGGPDGWRFTYGVQILAAVAVLTNNTLFRASIRPMTFTPDVRPAVERMLEFDDVYMRAMQPRFIVLAASLIMAWASKSTPDPWIAILMVLNIISLGGIVIWMVWTARDIRNFFDAVEQAQDAALARERGEIP